VRKGLISLVHIAEFTIGFDVNPARSASVSKIYSLLNDSRRSRTRSRIGVFARSRARLTRFRCSHARQAGVVAKPTINYPHPI